MRKPAHGLAAHGSLFQIPMRGNETAYPFVRLWIDGAFQIPMRGNELIARIIGTPKAGVFQIPMRGNEPKPTAQPPADGQVSNPHEG